MTSQGKEIAAGAGTKIGKMRERISIKLPAIQIKLPVTGLLALSGVLIWTVVYINYIR